MRYKRLGILWDSAVDIPSIVHLLCMYGTIPFSASFSKSGMEGNLMENREILLGLIKSKKSS